VTKISLQYDIVNFTPADANPVEANYSRVAQHINQELIERDGSVGMRAELLLADDPLTPLGAATKQYVDQVLPIGMMMPFGGVSSPPGGKWLTCDGTELATAEYPALFAVIGNYYVIGTPTAGRFNLPDLRQRFPCGAQPGATEVGARGGSADAIVAPHTHPIDHAHLGGATATENVAHYHNTPDHLHGLNNNTGNESADHDHLSAPGTTVIRSNPFAPAAWLQGGPAGSGWPVDQFDLANVATGGRRQDHYHYLGGTTGAADRSLSTGTESANHAHGFDTPNFAGASGAASGAATTAVGQNLPPFVAMTWIIRVV
jgi:microcystin-dependent protein